MNMNNHRQVINIWPRFFIFLAPTARGRTVHQDIPGNGEPHMIPKVMFACC